MSMTLAVVAPAAPAAFDTVVLLGSIIAFVVCWGLLHSWKATIGRFLLWLAGVGFNKSVFGSHISWHPFGRAATFSTDVEKWLSQGMAASERAMVKTFSALYAWATWIVTAPFRLGEATYTAVSNLSHRLTHTVPKTIRETVVKPITKTIVRTAHTTVVRVGNLDKAVSRAEAQIAHYAHVVQHSIATTLPRLGNLERTAINARSLPKWLKRHLVALLAGGILLRALSRIGLGWLKCRNVTKTAKRICGLDKGFLDALLAGTILIAGTISLRDFAKEVEDITEEASDLIHGFLRDA